MQKKQEKPHCSYVFPMFFLCVPMFFLCFPMSGSWGHHQAMNSHYLGPPLIKIGTPLVWGRHSINWESNFIEGKRQRGVGWGGLED